MPEKYSLLLYYHYTYIADPELFREKHHQLCLKLDLRGRIIVAAEGLNGAVSGLKENCQTYMEHLKGQAPFKGIDFKVEAHQQYTFQKLHIRVKNEIVYSGLTHINPTARAGKYLSPKQLQKWMGREDIVLVDMRSSYEHSIGKFKGAITLPIDNFRELPEKVTRLAPYKNKKIVTYCTGGVKCEKGSAFLLEKGFRDVYQLHGGIIKYGLETEGEHFEGKCYVFDNRIATPINKVNPTVITSCYVCQRPSDHMVNCANVVCNRHTVICEDCMEKMAGGCCESCKNSPHRRQWNKRGYYPKEMNGYNPSKCAKRLKKKSH